MNKAGEPAESPPAKPDESVDGPEPAAPEVPAHVWRAAAERVAEALVSKLIQNGEIAEADKDWFVERACTALPRLATQALVRGDTRVLEEVVTQRVRNLANFRYLRTVQYSTLWTKLLNRARAIVHDPELAKDVVQATFVRATRAAASYRGDGTYETWLGAILWHVISTECRTGPNTLVPSAALSGLANDGPSPESLESFENFLFGSRQSPEKKVLEREILGKVFERIRVLLTDRYSYRVIFLTFVEQKTPKEVARILGITLSHYYKILATARKRLRNSPSVRALLALEGIDARPPRK